MTFTDRLKRLARDPLIHFLVIGVGIYATYGLLQGEPLNENARTVTVTQGEIQALTDQWTRLWNRPPTEEELAGVMRDHVRTQILYREARAMGLDQQDTVIERRLAQKVELLSRSLVTPQEPTDEVLGTWYAENMERFRAPDTYTITQVFFDPDQRGDSTLDDAQAALSALRGLTEVPADLEVWGDRSLVRSYYPGRTEFELRKALGSGFTEQLTALAPGQWHGPVLSGFGTHLVYIHGVTRAADPALADIREQVREAWMEEQVNELSERFIATLIERYEVVVEETPVALTVPQQESAG